MSGDNIPEVLWFLILMDVLIFNIQLRQCAQPLNFIIGSVTKLPQLDHWSSYSDIVQ